jgi:hypothetical protein
MRASSSHIIASSLCTLAAWLRSSWKRSQEEQTCRKWNVIKLGLREYVFRMFYCAIEKIQRKEGKMEEEKYLNFHIQSDINLFVHMQRKKNNKCLKLCDNFCSFISRRFQKVTLKAPNDKKTVVMYCKAEREAVVA